MTLEVVELLHQPPPASWRRRLRLSIRGLIVLVFIIAGWLGWVVNGARDQRDAVAAIRRAGGFVQYDWEWKDGVLPQGQPERDERTVNMVAAMTREDFGTCTNHAECEASCPKEIPLEFIARLNRDLLSAIFRPRREPMAVRAAPQPPADQGT